MVRTTLFLLEMTPIYLFEHGKCNKSALCLHPVLPSDSILIDIPNSTSIPPFELHFLHFLFFYIYQTKLDYPSEGKSYFSSKGLLMLINNVQRESTKWFFTRFGVWRTWESMRGVTQFIITLFFDIFLCNCFLMMQNLSWILHYWKWPSSEVEA